MKCFIHVGKRICQVLMYGGLNIGALVGVTWLGIATQRTYELPDVAGCGFTLLYSGIVFGAVMGVSECRRGIT